MSLTFELTGFKWPDRTDDNIKGSYVDLDMYGTVNFSDNFGIQTGYRTLDLGYLIEEDSVDIKLKGNYLGGVLRF